MGAMALLANYVVSQGAQFKRRRIVCLVTQKQ
jgi:hypothetical protein